MAEEDGNVLTEKISAQPITLESLVKRHIDLPQVSFYEVDINSFYDSLTNLYQQGNISSLDGSMAACIGGAFRSSRINSEFHVMGVKMPKTYPDSQPNKGMSILTLYEALQDGSITEGGKLLPKGFATPLETLYVTIDPTSTEFVHLIKLAKTVRNIGDITGKEPKLNIVLIPSEENELSQRGRKFEDDILKLN